MDSHVSQITPAAVPALAPPQPCACATSTAARKPEFADRIAYFANVRRSVAEASGEVISGVEP
jgi:hypothetical protein